MSTGYGFPSGGIFAQPLAIGGYGGTEFTECKTDTGLLVKKLGVWYSDQALQAIQVTYTGDSVGPVYGTYINPTVKSPSLQTRSSLKLAYGAMGLGNDLGIFNS